MLDHKDVLRALVTSVNGRNAVYVRETNFGYVIRSERAGDTALLREKSAKFLLFCLVVAAIGIWVVPTGFYSIALTALLSVLFVAVGGIGFAVLRGGAPGIELHVDMDRQELRSAVITARGNSWICSSARFGDVDEIFLQRTKPEEPLRSLCLKIVGEDEEMPVAVGEERALMSVHARLARDLRPMQERLKRYTAPSDRAASAARQVFPSLGPGERSA